MSDEYIVRSITIAEVISDDGQRYLSISTEGDPASWDTLGMLDWATVQIRLEVEPYLADGEDD